MTENGYSRSLCIIRTDATEEIGMGHFVRCVSLAEEMEGFGLRAHFALKYITENALSILDKKGHPYDIIPESLTWAEESRLIGDLFQHMPGAIILDISHPLTLSDSSGLTPYFKLLRKLFPIIAVIDGFRQGSLSDKISMDVDLVVTPYYCDDKSILSDRNKGFIHLIGPQYAIFHPDYKKFRNANRGIAKSGFKVLVTMGGSDPKSLTVFVLEGLDLFKGKPLEIRVVIGPNFKPGLKKELRGLVHGHRHDTKLIESPSTLGDLMNWCDLAVSDTGLTKYELALTGTPAIFLSHSAENAEVNKVFQRGGTGWDLGLYSGVLPADMNNSVNLLLNDVGERYRMSISGFNLVDNKGAGHILSTLKEIGNARR